MDKKYGLIGYPLTHSFSRQYFRDKWAKEGITGYSYDLFPLTDLGELSIFIKNNSNLCGLNVTIPYKQSIIPLLHHISEEAAAIGAVNCIAIENGKWTGYNTDAIGFEQTLVPLLQPHHKQAWILGTGGASKAVQYVLKKLGISYCLVSRQPQNGQIDYLDLSPNAMSNNGIIINTTPLGMFPNEKTYPILPYTALNEQYLCYDLVYNPAPTLFLQKAAAQGAICKDGLEMLYRQADAAWDIWANGNV